MPELFRGEVWDVRLPRIGNHPAIVMSVNPANQRLGHVAVVVITRTAGPAATQIPLDGAAGWTGYPESYADITSLQPLAKAQCVKRRGLLATGELAHIERQLRIYLGL